jgi:two-component system response regulator MprA
MHDDDVRIVAVERGLTALRRLTTDTVDAVVLRLDLPDLHGIDVCRRVRTLRETAGVLALETTGRAADRARALDAGADDCLSEPCDVGEFAARIRVLTRRVRQAPMADTAPILSYAGVEVDLWRRQAVRAGRPLELTATEFDLLAQLVRQPERVLTHDDLLMAVWAYPAATTTNTLRVYMGYLRRKLEADGQPRLLQTVRGVGYVMRSSQQAPRAMLELEQ